MMIHSHNHGELAADFFSRVESLTNTCVIWPSQLKIGAKNKKDPYIRVGGTRPGVMRAKAMIKELLYTAGTSGGVTMKMDVSYTDHSHVIGKGGLRLLEESWRRPNVTFTSRIVIEVTRTRRVTKYLLLEIYRE